jgi:Ca2+-binding RTX toxin-like protein
MHMAKFVLTDKIGDFNFATFNYFALAVTAKSATALELAGDNGYRLVYSGSAFAYDGDTPTAGNVTKVEFLAPDGDPLLTISNGNFKLPQIFTLSPSAETDIFNILERGNDIFTGSANDDVILYGTNDGNDTIKGLGGNDYIQGSDGKNTIDGGAGNGDILTYQNGTDGPGLKGIKVDLDAGKVTNPWGKIDTVKNIEEVRGTTRADILIGSKKDDILVGSGGNDKFTGGKGDDEFVFESTIGKSSIADFDDKGGDDLVVFAYIQGIVDFSDVKGAMKQKGSDVIVDFGDGNTLTFLDIQKKELKADDFEFPLG